AHEEEMNGLVWFLAAANQDEATGDLSAGITSRFGGSDDPFQVLALHEQIDVAGDKGTASTLVQVCVDRHAADDLKWNLVFSKQLDDTIEIIEKAVQAGLE